MPSLKRKGETAPRAEHFPEEQVDHFSTAEQAEATAAKYFSGKDDLLLIAVDKKRLGDALRFEASRGGALFPHLYADLPLDAVVFAKPLPLRPDGRHDFTGLLGIIGERGGTTCLVPA